MGAESKRTRDRKRRDRKTACIRYFRLYISYTYFQLCFSARLKWRPSVSEFLAVKFETLGYQEPGEEHNAERWQAIPFARIAQPVLREELLGVSFTDTYFV
mmetsp:Transcript_79236/g.155494  ORF Transcript_79236/g.155494 Transcript_79236/m.155494 type:complete len:101 (-) Transcript_79236:84-386(-)